MKSGSRRTSPTRTISAGQQDKRVLILTCTTRKWVYQTLSDGFVLQDSAGADGDPPSADVEVDSTAEGGRSEPSN